MGKQQETYKPKLLIVDDDQNYLDLLIVLFEKANYEVYCSSEGATTIPLIKKHNPDLVILDVILDDISGYDILKEIRATEDINETFVVLMSSIVTDAGSKTLGLDLGADGYVSKTINNKEFVARVNAFIKHKEIIKRIDESEKWFRKIVEQNADAILILDQAGIVIFSNPAAQSMFEKTEVELLNHHFGYPIVHNENAEIEIQKKDGFRYMAEMRVVEIEWDNQAMFLASLRDISERKQNELELDKSMKKYQSLFENTFDAILLADNKAKYVDVNEAATKLFGFTREEFKEMHVWDITPDMNVSDSKKMWNQFIKEGIMEGDYEIRTKSGELIIAHFKAVSHVLPGIHMSVLADITKEKRYKQRLIHEKNKAERYLDISGVMFISLDRFQNIVLANKKASEILGYKQEELIGMNWFNNFLPQANIKEVKKVFDQIISGEIDPVKYYENPVITKSGEERIIFWHNSIVYDDEQSIIGLLSSGNDVTELKKAERKLKESEELYRNITNYSVEGIFWHNMEGTILFINETGAKMFKATPDDIIGRNIIEFHTTESKKTGIENLALVKEKGNHKFEVGLKKMKGSNFIAEIWSSIISIGDDTIVQGVMRDLTKEKEAQEALKESEEKYRIYIDSAPMGIFIISAEGKYVEINKKAAELTGYTEKELLELGIPDIKYHEGDEDALKDFKELKTSGKLNIETRYKKKDGTIDWWHISAVKINEERYLGFATDISERKKYETELNTYQKELETIVAKRTYEIEQQNQKLTDSQKAMAFLIEDVNEARIELEKSNNSLEVANKELESFSYSVSHDLRAPLTRIDGFSKALLDLYKDSLDEKGQHYLNRIRVSSQRMAVLIDEMLSLSRLIRQKIIYREVDFSKLAHEVFVDQVENFTDKDKFVFEKQENIFVKCDREMMRILLANIISNALKFSANKEKPVIKIGTKAFDENEVIFIEDNGVGFDMKYYDQIFKPFQRLHANTEYEGTGIGLATVQRIISRHQGEIWAESEENIRTTFYMKLEIINNNE